MLCRQVEKVGYEGILVSTEYSKLPQSSGGLYRVDLGPNPAAPHSEFLTTNGHRHGLEGAAQTDVHPGASGNRQDHHGHRDHLRVDCHGQGPHLGHCLLQQGYAVVRMQREDGFSTPDPPPPNWGGGGVREMGSIDRTINQLF